MRKKDIPLGVCPMMIVGNAKRDIEDSVVPGAFNASRFQCLGNLCMVFVEGEEYNYCGLSKVEV